MSTVLRDPPMRKKPLDREDVGIEPPGGMVEIFTAKSYRGVPVNDTSFMVTINGYKYKVRAGGRCIVPRQVYEVMKNARSRRNVIDPKQAERLADLGLRTDKNMDQNPPLREDSICDFEVEFIREIGKREV